MSARSQDPSRDARPDRHRIEPGLFLQPVGARLVTYRRVITALSRPAQRRRATTHISAGQISASQVSDVTTSWLRRSALKIIVMFVAAVAMLGALPSPSFAQDANSLKSTVPVDGSTVREMPTELQFIFSQPVRGNQKLVVAMACPGEIPLGEPDLSTDRLVITVPITAVVPRGSCFVQWSLTDADGVQILAGAPLTFNVEADPPVSTPDSTTTTTLAPATGTEQGTGTPPPSGSGGTIWFGRLLSMIGIMALFGGVSMIAIGWREGPEYVLTARYLRAVWLLALIGALITMIAVAADATGSSFGGGLGPTAWFEATSTWAGRSALMALVLVIASASVAYAPERVTDPATAPWAWGLPALALVALALIRVAGPLAPIGVLFNIVHLFTGAICFGGAALVFRAVLAGAGGDDLIIATRTFSRVAIPALFVTVVTGVVQMLRLDGIGLLSSSHGRVVLLKIFVVGGLGVIVFGVRNQVALRLDHAHEISESTAARLRRPFFAEAAIGVVILALSAWMLALTPPAADPLRSATYTLEIPIDDSATGIKAVASLGPLKVGKNGFKLEVSEPPSGISSLVVNFIPPTGSGLGIIEQPIPLTGAGTAYRLESDGFPFDAAGQWTLQLVATTSIGSQPGANFTFEVAPADGAAPVTATTVAGTTPEASTTTLAPSVSVIEQSTTTAPFAGGG